MHYLSTCFLFFLVAVVSSCPEGQRFRAGSFYKECRGGEVRRAGCYADWLSGEEAFIPFQQFVDFLYAPDYGYRYFCRSRGNAFSFQSEACIIRDRNGIVRQLERGDHAKVLGRNGRLSNYFCRP